MQLDPTALEAQPRPGHVHAPDAGRRLAHLLDAGVPVLLEVAAPLGEGERVVLAEVLLVADLEARVLGGSDDRPGADQLAVQEDVAVDEGTGRPQPVVGAGDAVVEQQPAHPQPIPDAAAKYVG